MIVRRYPDAFPIGRLCFVRWNLGQRVSREGVPVLVLPMSVFGNNNVGWLAGELPYGEPATKILVFLLLLP